MKKLIIYGIEEYAEVAQYYFEKESDYKVDFFTVDKKYATKKSLNGKKLFHLKILSLMKNLIQSIIFIAIGFSNSNSNRKKIFEKLNNLNVNFASFISKDALVASNVHLGKNLFILEQNNLQPFVSVGDNVVMWSGNHIGHHSKIGSHAFITSHVVISGGVSVGESSFFGVNSTVIDHINIEQNLLLKLIN